MIRRAMNQYFWRKLAAFQSARPFQIRDQIARIAISQGLILANAANELIDVSIYFDYTPSVLYFSPCVSLL